MHKYQPLQGAGIAASWQNVIVNLHLPACDRLGEAHSSVTDSTVSVCTVIQMFTSQTPIWNVISSVCIDCKPCLVVWLTRTLDKQAECLLAFPLDRKRTNADWRNAAPDLSLTQLVGKTVRKQAENECRAVLFIQVIHIRRLLSEFLYGFVSLQVVFLPFVLLNEMPVSYLWCVASNFT